MAKAFTDKAVQNFKPNPSKRIEIADPAFDGLYIVVQSSGAKSWALRYRFDGKACKYTIGRYPRVTIKDARLAATELLDQVERGNDPAAAKRIAKAEARRKADEPDRDSVRALVEQFHKRHLSQLKSGDHAKQFLDRFIVAEWGDRNIAEIKKRDALDLLDAIVDSGRATTANRVHAHARSFFNWTVDRDIIEVSPWAKVKAPAKENTRSRYLDETELKLFWHACEELGYPWGDLGRMILLTGGRLNEVAQMTDEELYGDEWRLAGERTKNGTAHNVHLSGLAIDVLNGIERIENPKGYVFTTNGRSHLQGGGKGLGYIQAAMNRIAGKDIPHWTFHDLRRTTATTMQRLRVSGEVIEAAINHKSGSLAGIAGVYQRHDFMDERKAAFEALGDYITRLSDDADNVVTLGAAS